MTLVVTHPYVSSIAESTASGVAGGLVGPNEWNANHTLTGVAVPSQGGTGITSGTGVTYFSSATVIADSGTLTANAIVLGGGANVAPTVVGSLGTTSTLLHGNASGAPSFGAVNLGSEVTGTLSSSLVALGGSNTNVQFNNNGVLGGDGSFTYTGAGTGVTVKLSSSTSTAGISALSIVTSSSSNMASNASALNIAATFNNSGTVYDAPLFMNVVNTASAAGSLLMDLQVGGSTRLAVTASGIANAGTVTIAGDGNGGAIQGTNNLTFYRFGGAAAAATAVAGFNSSFQSIGPLGVGANQGSADVALFTDGSALLAQRNGATAQTFRVYNTSDSAIANSAAPTNYERGVFDFTTTTNVLTIGVQAGGTGVVRPTLIIGGAGSGTSPVVSLNLATAKVAQIGDGGANANGWLNWSGESRVSANSTTTSTSFGNVPGLAFKPQANRNYSFETHLIFTDAAAGGIMCTVNATSTTTTYTLTFDGWVTDTVAVRGYAQGSAFGNVVASSLTTSTVAHVTITGTLMTSATAPSTVTIQFAQNTSNATPTTILIGSYMWAHDMP